jgi:hypothetical protein
VARCLDSFDRLGQRPKQFIIYAAVIATAVFLRTLFTTYVELSGDALEHWYFTKLMSEHFRPQFFADNHHTLRWATNMWPIAYAKLFGWSLQLYYVVPMLLFSLLLVASAFFVRLIDKSIFPFALFVVLFFAEPMFFRSTSHLLTFVFSAFYMMVAAIFLLRSTINGTQLTYALTALFFFLAYGAHENSLMFVPGASVFVLWNLGMRRGVLALLNIGAYALALILVETIVLNILSPRQIVLGRFELLSKSFSNISDLASTKYHVASLVDLMRPWLRLPFVSSVIVVAGLIAGIYLAARERAGKAPVGVSLPFFLMLSFFIFHTFALQSIVPIIPLAPPNVKYLANTTIWATLSIVFALNDLVGNWRCELSRFNLIRVVTLGVAILCAIVSLSFVQYRQLPRPGALFWHARESYAPMVNAIKKGMPLLTKSTRAKFKNYFEALFSTELVRINREERNASFFAYTTPEAVDDVTKRVSFCVDLRDDRNQEGGDWLIVCPSFGKEATGPE